MPSLITRFVTGAQRALRLIAEALRAKPVKTIFVGNVAQKEHPTPSEKAIRQARKAGRQLAAGR